MDHELGEIEAAFAAAYRTEQRVYADDLREEKERAATFRERLARLRRAGPVRVRLVSGEILRGRVTGVGRDWIGLVESERPAAAGPGALHEIRIDTIISVEVGR